MRRFFFWLVLIAVSVVVLVVGVELFLQAGAWIVRATAREAPVAAISDDLRILCLGDSNTYGLYLKPHQSWPAQLETRWNETAPERRIRVFNLGYPGTNSSRLLRDFDRMLEAFRPDFTIVMVGVNDFWTDPADPELDPHSEPEPERSNAPLRFVKRHSRLYRLAYMAARAKDPSEAEAAEELLVPRAPLRGDGQELRKQATFGDETFELGYSRNSRSNRVKAREDMRSNLKRIVEQARGGGTQLILMTYPAQETTRFYGKASREIRGVARRTETALVNLRHRFAARCSDAACRELLFGDGHPNAEGYAVVAELVSEKIQQLLDEPRQR
jgi:lysophospholipase L1-like esterase